MCVRQKKTTCSFTYHAKNVSSRIYPKFIKGLSNGQKMDNSVNKHSVGILVVRDDPTQTMAWGTLPCNYFSSTRLLKVGVNKSS